MKKNLLFIAAALLGFAACQDPQDDSTPKFEVPETTFNVTEAAQSIKVTVNTNVACRVALSTGADAWLHQQTKYSDDIIKEQGISFNVDKNEGAERTATIDITPASGSKVTLTVKQAAASLITTSLTLNVGDKKNVTTLDVSEKDVFTVAPETNLGAAHASATISFASDNETVLKHKGNGEFEALSAGSAKITVNVAEKAGAYTAANAEISVTVRAGKAVWNLAFTDDTYKNQWGLTAGKKAYENAGFNGVSIPANEGQGTWQFHMVSRDGITLAKPGTSSTYQIAAKGYDVIGPIVGDYAIWTVGEGQNFAAGTKFDFSCDQYQSKGQNAIWTIEYYDGEKWVAPAEYPVKDSTPDLTDPAGACPSTFTYNIINPSAALNTIAFSGEIKKATQSIQIRQTCMAYIRANKTFEDKHSNDGHSFMMYTEAEKGNGCTITIK